jgi:hypothetical protein
MLDASAWGVFLVTTLLVSALVHFWDSRRMKLGANDTPPGIDRP